MKAIALPIPVNMERTPNGDIALIASCDEIMESSYTFRKIMFAWHEKSYYGSLLKYEKIYDDLLIYLSPLMAFDYLSNPKPNQHRKIEWSEQAILWRRAAEVFAKIQGQGQYQPSFAEWKQGNIGWEFKLSEDNQGRYDELFSELEEKDPYNTSHRGQTVEAWFHDVMNELHERDAVAEASLRKQEWMDEEEWLISIGWKQDEIPYRTCLQLVEPEEELGWRLQLILQDKRDSANFVEFNSKGALLSGSLPAPWQEHIDRRWNKDIMKCIRIVPSLESAEFAGELTEELSDDDAWVFMSEDSLRLVQAGITVFLPSWWEALRKLKPHLRAKIGSSVGAKANTMFGMDQIVKFDWRIAIGQVDLTEAEFMQIAAEKKRLIHIRGKWIQLDPAVLAQMLTAMKLKKRGLSFREVLELHLTGGADGGQRSLNGANRDGELGISDGDATLPLDEDSELGVQSIRMEVELNTHLKQLMKKLNETKSIPKISAPTELRADLRPYQLEGVSWLLFLRQFGLGGCLADDMGLGKTIQFIAYLLHVKSASETSIPSGRSPSLLICPTSVLGNWQKELERFAPSLRVYLHYGSQRMMGEGFNEAIQGADLVITSYSLSHLDEEQLAEQQWDAICLDEAQNIKNAYTKQASSIRKLNGRQCIALTGTPIENRLTELWSIFDFINPRYLGSLKSFSHRFVKAIERDQDPIRIQQVQSLVRPFLLRRIKKDPSIQLDLPEKFESKAYVPLTVEQGTLYENIVQNMLDKIDTLTAMEKKGLILATLTKLKQICDHPALFLKEPLILDQAIHRSQKLARLLEMIEELRQEGERCLIFTQYVEMGHILKAVIEQERQEPVQFLYGGVPKSKRDEMIERFQSQALPEAEQCHIFLLSLKAGGTGLNLTAANHVFHYDRWWNPAVENQATDRAYRIGQDREVQVHKFVTLGTLEERIDEMIEKKQGLSEQVVGGGEGFVTEMSTSELRDLFALRKEWMDK